ncbi:MAG TPA: CopG family transcriptional regulator [Candidatus Omnitrophica bacterium]|nr:CopG family transcriptional regulator [Candidatus Omnitrophota bacterium]
MRKKIKYTDEPMEFKIIKDFLPPPEEMALRGENVKVTIQLSKASIEFFKKWAQKQHSHYQTMIRNILDYYTANYQ